MLRVEGLSAGYDSRPVVEHCSLEVASGQAVGIVGRNGSGKSTLLKAIAGEIQPLSGRVLVDDNPVVPRLDLMLRKYGVGYLPQYDRNIPNLTVVENLYLSTGLPWKQVQSRIQSDRELAGYFDRLATSSGKLAGNLSGGQNFILSMICLLLHDCRFLILDEPSAGVDAKNLSDLLETMRTLMTRGVGVLMVEQNEAVLAEIADVVYACVPGIDGQDTSQVVRIRG